MSLFRRLISIAVILVLFSSSGFTQDRGERPNRQQGNRPDMSSEEWKQQQAEIINKKVIAFMEKMGDLVPEDKVAPVAQLVQQHLVNELKLRLQVAAARQKIQGDREAMRNVMMNSRKKMEEMTAQTNAEAKKLLDKKALNEFKKNLEELTPNRAGGGGGGGRGGPGGGQGGGGRGGQDG